MKTHIFILTSVLFGLLISSSSSCMRQKDSLNSLCDGRITFEEDSWVKDELIFYNLSYDDKRYYDDQTKEVYVIKYQGSYYYKFLFKNTSDAYFDCEGNPINGPYEGAQSLVFELDKIEPLSVVWPLISSGGISAW